MASLLFQDIKGKGATGRGGRDPYQDTSTIFQVLLPVVTPLPRMAEQTFLPVIAIPLIAEVGDKITPPRCQGERSHKEGQERP